MISLDFDWQTNEFMPYCRSTQLREKTCTAMNKPVICLAETLLKLWNRLHIIELIFFQRKKLYYVFEKDP